MESNFHTSFRDFPFWSLNHWNGNIPELTRTHLSFQATHQKSSNKQKKWFMVIWAPLTQAQPRLILWYNMGCLIKQNVLILTFDKFLHKAIVSSYACESGNFNLFQGWVFMGFFLLSLVSLTKGSLHHHWIYEYIWYVQTVLLNLQGDATSKEDLTGEVQEQCFSSVESLRVTGLILQCASGA